MDELTNNEAIEYLAERKLSWIKVYQFAATTIRNSPIKGQKK